MKKNIHYLAEISSQIDAIPDDSILSRTLVEEGGFKTILFGFAPGQELSQHTASVPAVIHFLEGEASLSLGEEQQTAAPGTWVYLPAHLPHSIVAESKLIMVLYLLAG